MTDARLVQSSMFPNVWSIVAVNDRDDVHMFRDSLFANGAVSAEGAVLWARENGYRIVKVDMVEGVIMDPRSGRQVDGSADVIAGIEYRSRRPVIEVDDAAPTEHR